MTRPVTVEDQSGPPMLYVEGGVNGESRGVKYLLAEYYTHLLSQAANGLKLAPSELTTVLSLVP